MSNKFKRNLAFVMVVSSVFLYGLIILEAIFGEIKPDWWMWIAPVCCFIVFLGYYRNFSQAVKEDEKYGPIK